MHGCVFVDELGRAFKVYKGRQQRGAAEDEFELLKTAQDTAVADHVVAPLYVEGNVLVRQWVEGREGRWSDGDLLWPLFKRIAAELADRGWMGIEYKEDSFVFDEAAGEPVLIDASTPLRVGQRLLDFAASVARGDRESPEPIPQLCWALSMEVSQGRLTADEARPVREELGCE